MQLQTFRTLFTVFLGANGPSEGPPPSGSTLSPIKSAHPPSAESSPLSSPFSGLTPVASPGVSISSSFGDGDFDFPLSPPLPPNESSLVCF